jgi:hypothetical protein
MRRIAMLQVVGPTALFLSVLAAEAAAFALQLAPSSTELWYINLAWFGIFQRSYYVLGSVLDLAYFQFSFVALPIFLLAVGGLVLQRQLLLAIATNLSLVFVAFLFFCWWAYEPSLQQASLTAVSVPAQPDFYLCVGLLGVSLLSFVSTQNTYLRALRSAR